MHLIYTSPACQPLAISRTPSADTFDAREYSDLCEVVAATHLGGDLLPTVQAAVTGAKLSRGETWTAEAQKFLSEAARPTMAVVR